jgi:hypothetical protein
MVDEKIFPGYMLLSLRPYLVTVFVSRRSKQGSAGLVSLRI